MKKYIILYLIIIFNIVIFSCEKLNNEKNILNYQSNFLLEYDSKYFSISNYKIHYIEKGKGEPLILIHGGGTWLYTFRNNIKELSKKFHVIALDMPGHGYSSSSLVDINYGFDIIEEVLLEIIRIKNFDNVNLIGHSWGGGWSLYFTQKYPELINKIVLIDSSGLDVKDSFGWELLKKPNGKKFALKINRNMTKNGLYKAFFDNNIVNNDMINEVYKPLTNDINKIAQHIYSKNLNWKITEDNLDKVNNEVLIIWGKNDKYLSYKNSITFHNRLNKSKLFIIENAGHNVHEEKPVKINKIIINFLEKTI